MSLDPGQHSGVPMFPLGTVLVPSALLPLHLFEPRYLAMISDCVATRVVPDTVEALLAAADDTEGESWSNHEESKPFGVVLIERGSEVGGSDERLSVGCLAQILQARQFDDGRWHVVSVGTRRFRVLRWLDDDPYPRADIEVFDEPQAQARDAERLREVKVLVAEIRELAAALDRGSVPDMDLAEDPALASFQLTGAGLIGSLDRYSVLAASTPGERLDLLGEFFTLLIADLRAELDEAGE